MQPENKSLLTSSLAGYDSDWDVWGSKKRRILRGGRILAVAIWSALAVFLAWTIVADALDVRSRAEKRLVRIDPAELSPVTTSSSGRMHRFDWKGVDLVVADWRPGDAAPFWARIDDDRSREFSARFGQRCLVVTRLGSLPWHFAQLFLVFPLLYLAFRLTVFGMKHRIERTFLVRGLS